MTSGGEEQGAGDGRAITAIVRAVVARAVPEELPVMDGLAAADDDAIIARLARSPRADERLGFGLDDVAVLVSPVLYIVLDQSLRTVVDKALGGAGRRLRRVTRRQRPARTVPALSADQVAEIRDRVTDLARQRGVPADTVDRVGAAVVAVLSERTADRADGGRQAPTDEGPTGRPGPTPPS